MSTGRVFNIKKGDMLPGLAANLTHDRGKHVDISAAASVRFGMKPATAGTGPTIAGAATVLNAEQGQVLYVWSPGDTDVAGSYYAEFEVNWGAGVKQTFPTEGYFLVVIETDIA